MPKCKGCCRCLPEVNHKSLSWPRRRSWLVPLQTRKRIRRKTPNKSPDDSTTPSKIRFQVQVEQDDDGKSPPTPLTSAGSTNSFFFFFFRLWHLPRAYKRALQRFKDSLMGVDPFELFANDHCRLVPCRTARSTTKQENQQQKRQRAAAARHHDDASRRLSSSLAVS